MPWCPKCKLEYVEGKEICPDCKVGLVANLSLISEEENEDKYFDNVEDDNDETNEETVEEFVADPVTLELIKSLKAKGIPDDQIQEMVTIIKARSKHANATYKPISEKYTENKSGASILLIFGFAGIVLLLLNIFGVIHLPISGYTLYLTYIVMGSLFLIFFASGITSILNAKKLAPKIAEEEDNIQKMKDYLKKEYAKGSFELSLSDVPEEEKSLFISQMAVQACEDEFKDAAPGFSFYVVDRFYEEIFDTVSSEISSNENPADDELNDNSNEEA